MYKKYIKIIFPIVLGGIFGYAYYHYIGCYNGTCAITSNPYISTVYGAFLGLIFAIPSKKKVKNENK